ncbi:hypothetical protein ACB098_10G031500 [Castanea mollissima]
MAMFNKDFMHNGHELRPVSIKLFLDFFNSQFLTPPWLYHQRKKKFLKQKHLILLMNFVCESVYELTSRLTLLSLRCATTFLQNLIKDMAVCLYSTIFLCFSDKFPW